MEIRIVNRYVLADGALSDRRENYLNGDQVGDEGNEWESPDIDFWCALHPDQHLNQGAKCPQCGTTLDV